jgi:hypothetical protein
MKCRKYSNAPYHPVDAMAPLSTKELHGFKKFKRLFKPTVNGPYELVFVPGKPFLPSVM